MPFNINCLIVNENSADAATDKTMTAGRMMAVRNPCIGGYFHWWEDLRGENSGGLSVQYTANGFRHFTYGHGLHEKGVNADGGGLFH